jgi:hypothetical protein
MYILFVSQVESEEEDEKEPSEEEGLRSGARKMSNAFIWMINRCDLISQGIEPHGARSRSRSERNKYPFVSLGLGAINLQMLFFPPWRYFSLQYKSVP